MVTWSFYAKTEFFTSSKTPSSLTAIFSLIEPCLTIDMVVHGQDALASAIGQDGFRYRSTFRATTLLLQGAPIGKPSAAHSQ
jgi:hypothetical protein